MKKIFLFGLLVIFTMSTIKAQKTSASGSTTGPKIEFTKVEHDYGSIQKGANGNCEFTFKNIGTEPLILSSVSASCGCTTPSYSKEPIMPGKTGSVKVQYNTNNIGGFNKTITVNSNAENNPRTVLLIKGNVQNTEAPTL